MLKRIIVDWLICSALVAGGKIISNVAEKNPKLKVVKDNIKKTGKDFSANCKEVLDATRRVFTGETPDENTITLATETAN